MQKINNNVSDIRIYGFTNEAEFLAVSEYFLKDQYRCKNVFNAKKTGEKA